MFHKLDIVNKRWIMNSDKTVTNHVRLRTLLLPSALEPQLHTVHNKTSPWTSMKMKNLVRIRRKAGEKVCAENANLWWYSRVYHAHHKLIRSVECFWLTPTEEQRVSYSPVCSENGYHPCAHGQTSHIMQDNADCWMTSWTNIIHSSEWCIQHPMMHRNSLFIIITCFSFVRRRLQNGKQIFSSCLCQVHLAMSQQPLSTIHNV